jgi:hypothetical protein
MSVIGLMNDAFNLPVLFGMIPLLMVLRFLFRYLCMFLFSFQRSENKKMQVVDSLFYTACLACGIVIGEYFTRDESWRVDYDDCYR